MYIAEVYDFKQMKLAAEDAKGNVTIMSCDVW